MEWIVDRILIFLYYLFRIFPINNRKIVITSYLGRGYGDNGKYIADELLRQGKGYDIVWLCKDMSEQFPKGIRVVNYRSLKSIYEQVTARVWIDNRRKPLFVRKRPGQFYIMTWHSNIALKKVEKDVEDNLEPRYVASAKNDSKMIDLFLSGSRWETGCIRNAFWYDGPIKQCGYPRQDPFVDAEGTFAQKIRSYYGIDPDAKILLYAPTFRQSKDEKSLKAYKLDWTKTLAALEERFGGHWVGLIRLHPNVISLASKLDLPETVINVTEYNDMQELIVACDCLITDYSSTIMEAGIAKKIGLIYATDYDEYKQDRDVYFDIQGELPFPFSDSDELLQKNILGFNSDDYYAELDKFFNEEFGIVCNGDASKKVCGVIDKVISRKNRS